jgi:hypothetical protein
MTITIAPYTVDLNCDCPAPVLGHEKEEHIKKNHIPITYRRIHLNDKPVSYTFSKELAEKTKLRMER